MYIKILLSIKEETIDNKPETMRYKKLQNYYSEQGYVKLLIRFISLFDYLHIIGNNAPFKNENFGFEINYQLEKNQLICNQTLYVYFPNLLMPPEQFNAWNGFIKMLNKAYKESVILEKKIK
jgi:hypothetical protein